MLRTDLCTKSLDLSISGESRAIEESERVDALTSEPALNINRLIGRQCV